MFPQPVVPRLDIAENFASGIVLADKGAVRVDQLAFERGEEAFRYSIIPAISLPTHTACHPGLLQCILEKIACILDATIGVVNKAGQGLSRPYGHAEGVQQQTRLHV